MYDFEAKKFTPVSDYVGKNSYPMWIGNAMYFVSDRINGIANIFKQELGGKEVVPVTAFEDFDVRMASTDGKKIVFVQSGRIHVLDAGTHRDETLSVSTPSDRWTLRPRWINPKGNLHKADPANDGKTLILEARGDLFTLFPENGKCENLSTSPGIRETLPQISPDGKTVAFFSDKTGEYQIYLQNAEGGEPTALTTTLNRTNYRLVWSPDGKKLLFGNRDFSIFVLDIATRKMTKIAESRQMKNDEFYWEIADYGWSPDSRWICYSLVQENRNSRIFLYNIDQNKSFPVTDDFYDNLNPSFDAAGRYLYYLSSRNFNVQMDFYEDNHIISAPYQVMAVSLRDGEKPPFVESAEGEAKSAEVPFRVDTEGLAQRTYPLPVPAGNFFFLKAGRGKVLWCSVPKFAQPEYEEIFKPGGDTKWDLHIFDMASKKEVVLNDKIREFSLSSNGDRMIVRKEEEVFMTTPDQAFQSKAPGESVRLDKMLYYVDALQEWNQIFNDAWRWYRDFFYDPGMHGRDWKAMGDKYRAYIPYLSSREELNGVLSQMVGELCVSHTYVGGGDTELPPAPQRPPLYTGLLGADLAADPAGFYKFAKIYGPTEINLNLQGPLVRPDIGIKEGDFLLAINGTEIRPPQDYFRLLQTTNGKKILITTNSKPTSVGAKTYEIDPIRSDQQLRYFRWLTDNVRKVLKETDGRVGYMHINAMGAGNLGEFDKFWRAFRYKDAVIIDVRRNSGGWTEYFMIDKLERKLVAYNCLNGMTPFRYPGSAGNGRYVAISNEDNGSDGECFLEHFKARKLGSVVGVPSWGGLVGILNAQNTIDDGVVHQSNNAFYGKEGTWWVENHGADPDILVDNDPASVMAGYDLQLEKAIENRAQNDQGEPFEIP